MGGCEEISVGEDARKSVLGRMRGSSGEDARKSRLFFGKNVDF
jgi:hypothetical protein